MAPKGRVEMIKAAAGWYEPPAFATSHLVAATVATSYCRTLTKAAATVAAANCCARMCGTNFKRMTYGGPSLSNDGKKRKDGGRRSNLVATSPKADTHLALALNEYPYSNRVTLNELGVSDSVHESEDSHAFWGSLNMPTLSFIYLHKIFHGFPFSLLDVVDFYWILDTLILLKEVRWECLFQIIIAVYGFWR
ncbi:hypothetical protein Tco_0772849 [Tanacetum coccineum]|uniref:Uncharacterized protein n=1 Tax=Tanacetum coccineum TaxID=301880 RepID=A0ABQ4ZMX3_9ASTR